MWHKSESTNYPELVDEVSSNKFVYVRRNITEVEREDESSGKTITIYKYEENKIKKEDWETYKDIMNVKSGIASLEDAVCELTTLIESEV